MLAFLLPLLGVLTPGCYAEATTGAAVRTEYVPAHIETYPHEYYEGRTVYLIGDRWYYHDGSSWVYYRHEPEVLVRRRVVIHQAPPPVVREQTVVHEAPPARVRHHHHDHHHDAPDPARRHAQHRAPSAD